MTASSASTADRTSSADDRAFTASACMYAGSLDQLVCKQARRQEMKWGCVFFEWKMFFCKKVENGGGVFCKKWTFPQRRVHYVQYQYFLFHILLIWGRGAYAPLPTSLL